MVVSVRTRDVPARPAAGPVSGATANERPRATRRPFSREYLDYWAPLPEPEA